MPWRIIVTEEYERRFARLDTSIQRQVEKELRQLEVNPYVGKSLGYKFFREKKILNHRVYYIIYEELVVVFVVSLSDKKGQHKAISAIKTLIPFYREEIMKRVRP